MKKIYTDNVSQDLPPPACPQKQKGTGLISNDVAVDKALAGQGDKHPPGPSIHTDSLPDRKLVVNKNSESLTFTSAPIHRVGTKALSPSLKHHVPTNHIPACQLAVTDKPILSGVGDPYQSCLPPDSVVLIEGRLKIKAMVSSSQPPVPPDLPPQIHFPEAYLMGYNHNIGNTQGTVGAVDPLLLSHSCPVPKGDSHSDYETPPSVGLSRP